MISRIYEIYQIYGDLRAVASNPLKSDFILTKYTEQQEQIT